MRAAGPGGVEGAAAPSGGPAYLPPHDHHPLQGAAAQQLLGEKEKQRQLAGPVVNHWLLSLISALETVNVFGWSSSPKFILKQIPSMEDLYKMCKVSLLWGV